MRVLEGALARSASGSESGRPGRLWEHASATLGALRLLFCERGWLGCRLGRRVSESGSLATLRPLGSLRGPWPSLPASGSGVHARFGVSASESASLASLRWAATPESSDEPPRLGVWERQRLCWLWPPASAAMIWEGASPSPYAWGLAPQLESRVLSATILMHCEGYCGGRLRPTWYAPRS